MNMQLRINNENAFLWMILIGIGACLAYWLARRYLLPRLAAKYGAPPRPLLGILGIPVLGPLLYAMLPKVLAGENTPPVVRLLRFGAALLVFMAALNVVALTGMALWMSASVATPSDGSMGVKLSFPEANSDVTTAYLFATVGVSVFIFTLVDWRRRMGRGLAALGVSADGRALRGLGYGLAAGGILVSLLIMLEMVGGVRYRPPADGDVYPAIVVIVCLVIVAMWEEVVFRGYILEALRMQYGTGKAILASSLLFVLVHSHYLGSDWRSTLLAVGSLASFGAILCIARVVSGTLSLPIAIHFIWNAVAWALGYLGVLFPPAGSPWFAPDYESASRILVGSESSEGIFGPLLSIGVFWLVWRRYRRHPAVTAGPFPVASEPSPLYNVNGS